MKSALFFAVLIGGGVSGVVLGTLHTRFHADPQYAAGEWKIQVQTPPCDSVHNVQVIWPKESGAPITIECDQMPVPTK